MKQPDMILRFADARRFSPDGVTTLEGRAGGVYQVRADTAKELIAAGIAEVVHDVSLGKADNPPSDKVRKNVWIDPKQTDDDKQQIARAKGASVAVAADEDDSASTAKGKKK